MAIPKHEHLAAAVCCTDVPLSYRSASSPTDNLGPRTMFLNVNTARYPAVPNCGRRQTLYVSARPKTLAPSQGMYSRKRPGRLQRLSAINRHLKVCVACAT
jgi:hypothetical protein